MLPSDTFTINNVTHASRHCEPVRAGFSRLPGAARVHMKGQDRFMQIHTALTMCTQPTCVDVWKVAEPEVVELYDKIHNALTGGSVWQHIDFLSTAVPKMHARAAMVGIDLPPPPPEVDVQEWAGRVVHDIYVDAGFEAPTLHQAALDALEFPYKWDFTDWDNPGHIRRRVAEIDEDATVTVTYKKSWWMRKSWTYPNREIHYVDPTSGKFDHIAAGLYFVALWAGLTPSSTSAVVPLPLALGLVGAGSPGTDYQRSRENPYDMPVFHPSDWNSVTAHPNGPVGTALQALGVPMRLAGENRKRPWVKDDLLHPLPHSIQLWDAAAAVAA